jgi:geranylgeranyl pyrophosphate synthase
VQVVDDILDFTQTAEQLGKPQGQDLASGNLTAPVIYALQKSKELEEIIQSELAGQMYMCAASHVRSISCAQHLMCAASDWLSVTR